MRRATFGEIHCSLARAVDVVGDTWTPLILRDLFVGLSRFEDLVIDLGISRNLLTTRLEHLMDARVIERHLYQEHPQRFEYTLTDAGLELAPALIALMTWGDRWTPTEGGPPMRFRHDCGAIVTPVMTCPDCSGPVNVGTTIALAGPGGRVAPGTQLVGKALRSRTADAEGRSDPAR